MINLLVDEAYAFDYLSILYIKTSKSKDGVNTFEQCANVLKKQLPNYIEIISSKEYQNLVEANQITFDAVEKARYSEISAKEVDNANMLRHKRKIELQNRFFNSTIVEYKT